MVDVHSVPCVLLPLFTLCPLPSFLHGMSLASLPPPSAWAAGHVRGVHSQGQARGKCGLNPCFGEFLLSAMKGCLSGQSITQLVPSPYLLVEDT